MMSNIQDKLAKVNDYFTVNRYDNGFMVEIGGRDADGEWETAKILCATKDDLLYLIQVVIAMPLSN
jgi:hypothetical protein